MQTITDMRAELGARSTSRRLARAGDHEATALAAPADAHTTVVPWRPAPTAPAAGGHFDRAVAALDAIAQAELARAQREADAAARARAMANERARYQLD